MARDVAGDEGPPKAGNDSELVRAALVLLEHMTGPAAGEASLRGDGAPEVSRAGRLPISAAVVVELLASLAIERSSHARVGNEAAASRIGNVMDRITIGLSAIGRRVPTLEAAREAVAHNRKLAADGTEASLPGLASALADLGQALAAAGHREPALAAAQEAADLFRKLAAGRPDLFLPELAAALHKLGLRLARLGRRKAALDALREAIDMPRRLAADGAGPFIADLARSLGTLGTVLTADGRLSEAKAALEQGLRLARAAFPRLPQTLEPLMRALAKAYLRACAAAGTRPDPGVPSLPEGPGRAASLPR